MVANRPRQTPEPLQVPSDWVLAPLGSRMRHVDERSVDGIGRLLSISKTHGVVPRDVLTDAAPRAASLVGYKRCAEGDLVVNQMSVYDGLLGVAPLNGLVTYHYLVFRPAAPVDVRYLGYLLRTDLYMGDFAQRVRGIGETTQGNVRTPHIRISDFLQTVVPFPPLAEQARIADFLDDQTTRIDQIIEARREQSAGLSQMTQSLIDELFEGDGRTFGWIPLRRLAGGIEQGWSPTCENLPALEGQHGVLKLSAVRDGRFLPYENKAMVPDSVPDWRYALRRGDLLISRANTPERVGDSAVVDSDYPNLFLCDLLYRVSLLVPEAEYVGAALRTTRVRSLLRVLGRGTSLSMSKIRGEDVLSLPVPSAPAPVRIERDSVLSHATQEVDGTRESLQRSIALLQEFKRSLISAAVSGEFDVSAASGRGVPA